MIEIGKYAELEIEKIIQQGAYLLTGDETASILLPTKYIPEGVEIGDMIRVFIYRDSEDKLIATTQTPYALIDECAYLTVKSQSNFGAFLDWGLLKDLLVPFREQNETMQVGKSYLVRLYVDKITNRIVGTQHINKFLRDNEITFQVNDEVEILVCNAVDLGYKVIVNNQHWGMLYKNQIFCDIEEGQKLKAWVKLIREDGKIDVSLQQPGFKEVLSAEEKILHLLQQNNGYCELNDSSSPDEIYAELQISKKVFKKAIGKLFREKHIMIEENGIRIV
ncbi:MAG: S1-like domain-containing RNA-binding protein [Bacteroidetes bacterium]|nr:S1-like domain-containing RNA-binding protein [Bacteroidota bacterium]